VIQVGFLGRHVDCDQGWFVGKAVNCDPGWSVGKTHGL